MKEQVSILNHTWKRLLITVFLLLCTACSLAVSEPDLSFPEPPANIREQQPSSSPREFGETAAEADNQTGSPSGPPQPAGAEGRQDKPADTGDARRQAPSAPAENHNNDPTRPGEAVTSSREPAATPNEPAAAPSEPAVLTVSGSGVNAETAWTLSQLQSYGYHEYTYSTTNNWPSYGHMTARGISLPLLLEQAGLSDRAASFKLIATDGYYVTVTYNQIFGRQLTYANHGPAGSGGASAVEPIIAWAWGENGKVREEALRSFFGQSGPMEVNTLAFVKNLCKIEVSTASAGAWAAPGASVADGSVVSSGTECMLSHENMDSVRIYYTLDGSEPAYNSPVYNPSTSYYQPQLTEPLILTKSVTVKAFAAALGKERSPVAVFRITVE